MGVQFGDQYIADLNISGQDVSNRLKGLIDEVDISYYHKYYQGGRIEGKPDKGFVHGWDFMIRNYGEINYSIKYSNGTALLNGRKMDESVEDIVSVDFGIPIFDFLSMTAQYMYNGGYSVRVMADNTNHIVGKAQYVSVGATYKVSALNTDVSVSGTASNILRLFNYNAVPVLGWYKIGGSEKSISMPTLGNIVISFTKEF